MSSLFGVALALCSGSGRALERTATTTKLLILIWRKPGLSREAFIDYYEQHHAPLARRLVPQIAAAEYRRNYVETAVSYIDGVEFFDFDVITEISFVTHAAYEDAMRTLALPEVSTRIVSDEERFIDRRRIQPFVMKTYSSPHAAPNC